MSRILIATVPVAGHLMPGLRICHALVERGHEVWWYTGRKYQRAVERSGAQFLPMHPHRDIDDANLDGAFEGRAALQGVAQLRFDMMRLFIDPIPDQVADLERLHEQYRFDVMLHDVGFLGMNLFAAKTRIPYATYGISALAFPSRDTAPFGFGLTPSQSLFGRMRNRMLQGFVRTAVFREAHAHYEEMRRRVGLGPSPTGWFLSDAMSPYAFLQGCTPGFEYPRTDMPPHVEFVGPFLPRAESSFVAPSWWSDLKSGKPVVHVTQGTIATRSEQLIVPTLRALANEDVLVVVTTGGASVDSLPIDRIPDNVRIEPFIPYAQLMPEVDVMITNAGYGGVQAALAHGVPLIAAGQSEDKPEVAQRIAWSAVGIDLRTGTPTKERILKAFRELTSDPRYRENARRLQHEIAQTDAPTRAAVIIEQLAQSKGVSKLPFSPYKASPRTPYTRGSSQPILAGSSLMTSLTRYLPDLARITLGLIFSVFGLDGFLHFIPLPPLPGPASDFLNALTASGFVMLLVKGVESVAGLFLLAKRFVPLALVLLAPIVVVIVGFHLVLAPASAGIALPVLALELYLARVYRTAFAPMLRGRFVEPFRDESAALSPGRAPAQSGRTASVL